MIFVDTPGRQVPELSTQFAIHLTFPLSAFPSAYLLTYFFHFSIPTFRRMLKDILCNKKRSKKTLPRISGVAKTNKPLSENLLRFVQI